MDMARGTEAKTLDEAEAFIRDFILELRNDNTGRMRRHSGEYDLFLPWLWEEIVNSGSHERPAHCETKSSRLFMDAAWSLVQKGYLRPGPHKISDGTGGNDHGKGYSVTFKGEDWLSEVNSAEPSLDASLV
ncbi:hypothetical protein EON82_08475 [bacterium]|nr:MAG: hypothetical protein EON82_08475 [bacterium]